VAARPAELGQGGVGPRQRAGRHRGVPAGRGVVGVVAGHVGQVGGGVGPVGQGGGVVLQGHAVGQAEGAAGLQGGALLGAGAGVGGHAGQGGGGGGVVGAGRGGGGGGSVVHGGTLQGVLPGAGVLLAPPAPTVARPGPVGAGNKPGRRIGQSPAA